MLELCSDTMLLHHDENKDHDNILLIRGTYCISLMIEDNRWQDFITLHKDTVADIIQRCFDKVGILSLKTRQDNITITFTSDAYIQDINKQWRDVDKATNVLSFPSFEREELQTHAYHLFPDMIEFGDILIAWDYCQREAKEANIPFLEHIAHMVIHGMLHILGYDHIHSKDAELMENLEVCILKEFGFAHPYGIV